MSSTALVPSLVRPSSRVAALAADVVLVALGVGLIALSAQVVFYLPWTPVPITGQTFGVLLIGGAYGATRGFATLATYLVVGGLGERVTLGSHERFVGQRRVRRRTEPGVAPGQC